MQPRLSVTYRDGIPNGGYLVIRPLPEHARVMAVFEHTFLVVSPERQLVSIQCFSENDLNLVQINRILEFFHEKPLARLL